MPKPGAGCWRVRAGLARTESYSGRAMVAAVVGEGRKGGVTGLGGAEAQREGEDGKQAAQDRKGSRGAGR
jgi:hypothetical protein